MGPSGVTWGTPVTRSQLVPVIRFLERVPPPPRPNAGVLNALCSSRQHLSTQRYQVASEPGMCLSR